MNANRIIYDTFMTDSSGIFSLNFESILTDFNNFMSLFFIFSKYIIAGLLICFGSISLLKLKGMYSQERLRNSNIRKSYFFKSSRFILGNVYLILGIGFLFNFLIYALILMFNLIPDMLIIPLLRSIKSIPQDFISDYFINNNLETPLEIFVENVLGIISLLIFLSILLSVWRLIVNKDYDISKYAIGLSIGIITGCLFSFSKFLPFLL
ncbi:MAG: hypothetical protein ACXABO_11275 [Promethearchaeota archaeon]|jgi:hypothetical protein